MKSLSARQFEVMDILWSTGEPMIASQILEANEDLNINTVQAVLKSLMKKGFIELADIVYSGTVLARRYQPIITKSDYINGLCSTSGEAVDSKEAVLAFVRQQKDLQVLEELEQMIKEAKEKMKG